VASLDGPSKARGFSRVWETLSTAVVLVAAVAVTFVAIQQWRGSRMTVARRAGAIEPPIPTQPISLTGLPSLGSKSAPVVLMVFSDFQCPFCRAFAEDRLAALRLDYIDRGRLRIVFRHWPLGMHANARPAARVAICAADQQKFWKMHDELFANPNDLGPGGLTARAAAAGLDQGRLAACLVDPRTEATLTRDRVLGQQLQLTSTPSSLVGLLDSAQRLDPRKWIIGAPDVTVFRTVLEALSPAPNHR